MAYVKANTAPTFGSRSQSISPLAQRLGAYMRASFPLPTTSMSAPVSTRLGLGNPSPGGIFWDGPYPAYGQPETSATRATALSGEWVPPSAPGPLPFDTGALTYRIDPQTGQYKFSVTDITPRGVWQQNVFQHPVKPALSALGIPIRRGRLSGTSGTCSCAGRCGLRGLGDECSVDSDCGANGVCGAGVCYTQGPFTPTPSGVIVSDPMLGPVPSGVQPVATPSALQQATNGLQQIANALAPPRPVTAAPVQQSGLFTGSTNIAGLSIPNPILFGGVALLALGLGSGGRRR